MRDQHSQPPMNKMLIGVITSTLSHEGSTFATPYEQYADWGDNIIFFYRHLKSDAAQRQGCSEHCYY